MNAVTRLAAGLLLTASPTLALAQADRAGVSDVPPPPVSADVSSYANVDAIRVTGVALDLSVDFERRQLRGSAELSLKRIDPEVRRLVLDTRALAIDTVEAHAEGGGWQSAPFVLAAADPVLGQALMIDLPKAADAVRVRYATSPEASGLQWLEPAQTAGRQWPFLFSQSQAIHARSWIPLQDTPQVRAPYTATVRVPKGLRAVMSAEMRPAVGADGAWHFAMPQPIPSYLIALAVGDLGFKATGPRTGVYAEPSRLEAAAYEFAETEKTVAACEALYGPYRWGRYDLLLLPPSFPYGGMENPRLTFVTPTVVTGDRALVSLVAHELAHSWSGNLVTNATWNDFWLNEGFTEYLTYRLTDAVYGKAQGDLERVLGKQALDQAFAEAATPEDKVLERRTPAKDPDEVFSSVPYERGALFLTYLESKFGRARFDAFLRQWFDAHAFQSATTAEFVDFLNAHLLSQQPQLVSAAELDAWLHAPELPADAVLPKSDALAAVDAARAAWLAGGTLDAKTWNANLWQHFFDTLPAEVPAAKLQALDAQYGLSKSSNAIIASAWFHAAIAHGDRAVDADAARYVASVGRMKLVGPVYRAWTQTAEGHATAETAYASAKPGYHPITRAAVERILKKGS